MANNVVELVVERVTEELKGRFDQVIDDALTEGKQRIDQFVADARERADAMVAEAIVSTKILTPTVDDVISPIEWIQRQARSRALRTLAQGLLFALVTSFVTAVVQAVTDSGFDVTDIDDWKIALTLGAGALGTSLVSYLQNALRIKPPKV